MSENLKRFQIPAVLEGVSTLKDGGVSMRFHTNELNSDAKALAFDYQGEFGWLLFQQNEHSDESTKDLEAVRRDTGGKSPSQRLRSVLYKLYLQRGDSSKTFEQYYAEQMERMINAAKERLN